VASNVTILLNTSHQRTGTSGPAFVRLGWGRWIFRRTAIHRPRPGFRKGRCVGPNVECFGATVGGAA
jgi:hypothetical protein